MSMFNDIYYVASLIEFTGRKTKNRRSLIVDKLGKDGFFHLIEYADVNHCLSFEQVSDELIEDYEIMDGTFDTVSECKFEVPSATRIGRVYARLVETISESEEEYPQRLYEVLSSELPDAISNFNSSFFFAPADELAYYYQMDYAGS